MGHDLTVAEQRVLGSLLEKQRTTPDAYPLTLNGLRAACNQATNREPVMQLEEPEIRDALDRLYRRRWTRLTSTGRTAKYRHLLDDAIGLRPPEQAVLAVLLLRGPQTPGELRQRTDRLHHFADGQALEDAIEELTRRDLVVRLERRPGQKEARHAHLLGGDVAESAAIAVAAPEHPRAVPAPEPWDRGPDPESRPAPPAPAPAPHPPPAGDGRDERLTRLEAEVAGLRAELQALRTELGA